MKYHRIMIAVIATAVAIPFTFAAKGERKKNQSAATFASVDKDADGSVSKKEYVEARKATLGEEAAGEKFGQLDKNKDGKLDEQEYAADDSGAKKRGRKKKSS